MLTVVILLPFTLSGSVHAAVAFMGYVPGDVHVPAVIVDMLLVEPDFVQHGQQCAVGFSGSSGSTD